MDRVGQRAAVFPRLTPELIRQRTVAALPTFIVAETHTCPLVLLLEDVHWIRYGDGGSRRGGRRGDGELPLLLVLVYRPEYMQA